MFDLLLKETTEAVIYTVVKLFFHHQTYYLGEGFSCFGRHKKPLMFYLVAVWELFTA